MNKSVTQFSATAKAKLLVQKWPGNVRELRNVIERALIVETGNEIQPSDLPDFAVESRLQKHSAPIAADESLDMALERHEREIIHSALEHNNFNLTRAAEQLKLTRHALRYRMQRLNMKIDGESD
jgi:DNA-binding NtrC family response regulator